MPKSISTTEEKINNVVRPTSYILSKYNNDRNHITEKINEHGRTKKSDVKVISNDCASLFKVARTLTALQSELNVKTLDNLQLKALASMILRSKMKLLFKMKLMKTIMRLLQKNH